MIGATGAKSFKEAVRMTTEVNLHAYIYLYVNVNCVCGQNGRSHGV